jgi:hypothetical protein
MKCDADFCSCVTISLVGFGGATVIRAVSTSYNKLFCAPAAFAASGLRQKK